MSRRVIVILLACLGLFVLGNVIVLAIYLPRLFKSKSSVSTVAAQTQSSPAPAQQPQAQMSPAAPPAAVVTPPPVTKHAPLPDGAAARRELVSKSGKIRIKYLRSKGNPVRQIVLEKASNPSESAVFFEHQRNAWVLISPNDEWIALNNRPKAGESELQVYRRSVPDSLNYEIPQEFQNEGESLDNLIWTYYLEEIGEPAETPREGVAIDATGWDDESKKLSVTVTVTPADAADKVPPPWSCTFDVTNNQIEAAPEAAAVLQQQGSQTSEASASPGEGQSQPQAQAQAGGTAGGGEALQGSFPGERFPVTRQRPLSDDELAKWTLANVRYAINEIYARRGADFPDKQIKRQFSRFSWYHARPGISTDEIAAEFSEIEKQNEEALTKTRETKEGAAKQSAPTRRTRKLNPGERFIRSILRD